MRLANYILAKEQVRRILEVHANHAIAADRVMTYLVEDGAIPRMEILDDVLDELSRATAKFPTWPTDPLHAVAVLGEEFGELTQAVLQSTYEPSKSTPEDVKKEAVQVAAMALRFLMSLDRYEYRKGEQHEQGGV